MQAREVLADPAGRRVPGMLWTPAGGARRRPLVLIGHGGSQHKTHPGVVALAAEFVDRHGFAAFAIDGPIHGARRTDAPDGAQLQQEFLRMWRDDPRLESMLADWLSALDALALLPDVDLETMGWYGVSMGTAYGLPLIASERRIKAAVLGMWGAESAHGERLLDAAARLRCAVLFQQKWGDQLFTREGQLHLFERIGSPQKWLKIYPGEHVPVAGEQLADAVQFLVRRLAAQTSSPEAT